MPLRYRTRITSPPGSHPAVDERRDDESYSPGLALPREPRPPSRYRRLVTVVLVLITVAAAAWLAARALTEREADDPSLTPPEASVPAVTPTP